MVRHILFVGPDALVRRSLADQLTRQGLAVTEAASAVEAEDSPAAPDLVLVDAGPSDETLLTLCSGMRDRGVPILVLGPLPAEWAAWRAAGASECIAKPFRISHLGGRIQALMRERSGDIAVIIGDFTFHPVARLVVDAGGRRIHLTEKESAILAYLHQAGERVVRRDELLGEVWGYRSSVSTHTLETHIHRLRRKLDADGDASLLRTEGGGYRLARMA
jgi:DNA-binding response OmpR family regulator